MSRRILTLGLALAAGLLSGLVWVSPASAVVFVPSPRASVVDPMPGETFSLSGSMGRSIPRAVHLQRWYGGKWRTVKKKRTGKLGYYRFHVTQPTTTARWRVTQPALRAKGRTWQLRIARPVTLTRAWQSATISIPPAVRAGSPMTVTANFRPARPGRGVSLQVGDENGWRQVATGFQDGAGNATFTYTPGARAWLSMRPVGFYYNGADAVVGTARPFAALGSEPIAFAAHRGASATHPENTLYAIEEAIRQDADFIELDFRRTADPDATGPLEPSWVLVHDGNFARTTDIETKLAPERADDGINTFTETEIKTLDAGSWKGPQFACPAEAPATHPCRVPTLQEALTLIDGAMDSGYQGRIILEVKEVDVSDGNLADKTRLLEFYDLVKTLQPDWVDAGSRGDKAIFMTFDRAAAEYLHTMRGSEGAETAVVRNQHPVDIAHFTWARQVHVRHDLWGPQMAGRVPTGVDAAGWTVNSAEDIARMGGMGADIVTTDNVPYARSVLLR